LSLAARHNPVKDSNKEQPMAGPLACLARIFATLALFGVLFTAAPAAAQDDGPRLGTWYLVGWDTSHWRAELVIDKREGQGYTGRMIWRAVTGAPAGGTEPFHAEYDATTGTFRMQGEPVQGASGDIASGATYEARVVCDGRYLAYGRWSGDDVEDGTWVARHLSDAITAK